LIGYNTDATGALRALRDAEVGLTGRSIAMLGSGGAARAIAFALAAESGSKKLTLLGVDDNERTTLARDLRSKTSLTVEDYHFDEATLSQTLQHAHVLIHCTPVGMSPAVDATCVPPPLLHAGLAVMDIVYNPRKTRLLKDAARIGCKTIPGLEMFLNQAVAQFELWTDRPAPIEVMRRALESRFP
jgi:shikimate dehydrogenase